MLTGNEAAAGRGEKTYFAPGTVFEGTLRTSGDVEIDGEVVGEIVADGKVSIHRMGDVSISARDFELLGAAFKGDVTVEGEVIVDEQSTVHGNIRSSRLNCRGKIEGNLNVSESVTIAERAQVIGDVNTPSMDIARGAVVRGEIRMDG